MVLNNRQSNYLKLIRKHGNTKKARGKIFAMANKADIDACCALYTKALRGNLKMNARQKSFLKRHLRTCKMLSDPRIPHEKKRKILMGQTGGFLPMILRTMTPLLLPVVKAAAGGLLSGVFGNRSQQR